MRATPGRLVAAEKRAACRLCSRYPSAAEVKAAVTPQMLLDRLREIRADREAVESRADLLERADELNASAQRLRDLASSRPDVP